MDNQERISIVVATNNNYIILLAALLKSIEIHHKTPEPIDIYVIDDNVSESNKKKIASTVSSAMFTFTWRTHKEFLPADIPVPVDNSAFPLLVYLRLYCPYVVPPTVKRLIYMDVDMIAETDISRLYHTDMQGKVLGACLDLFPTVSVPWTGISNWKELGLDPDTPYFNAGLLLIDSEKWMAQRMTAKIMETLETHKKSVNLGDQYGLNVTFVNNWFQLDPRWNSYASKDVSDPWVIHYLDVKPIFKSYNSVPRYQKVFYSYLSQTPWKNHKPVSDYRRIAWKMMIKLRKTAMRVFSGGKLAQS